MTATHEPPRAPTFVHRERTFVQGGETWDLAAIDVNEDGLLDIATTTASYAHGVVLLLGRGDGSFAIGPEVDADSSNFVRASDVNGDGHADLVASGDRIAVLLGAGDGTFAQPAYYEAGPDLASDLNLLRPDVADLNGDGALDLVAANWEASQLAVLIATSPGVFGAAALQPCPNCHKAVAADLDGDRDIDVIAISHKPPSAPGGMYVFLNAGDGAMGQPTYYDPAGNSAGIALADLNLDGGLDIVTANDASGSISILLGNGDGTFRPAETYPSGNVHTLAVADFDRDGTLDVLAGANDDGRLWFYRGIGDGRFTDTSGFDVAPDVALSLIAADFDRDGTLDLALSYPGPQSVVSILLGKA